MSTVRYMLDTNMASYIIKGNSTVRGHLLNARDDQILLSSISQAELSYGVEKKSGATKLKATVSEFLSRVDILPFDPDAAIEYAHLRKDCESIGKSLSTMDMLIAAHSIAANAILITADNAFYQINSLRLQDWTKTV